MSSNLMMTMLSFLFGLILCPHSCHSVIMLFCLTCWISLCGPFSSWSALKAFSNITMTSSGWVLIILTLLVTTLMMSMCLYSMEIKETLSVFMACSLMGTLVLVFSQTNLLGFYLMFELTLIPIFWMILGWGSQPERLSAGMSLLLYTATASMPLLLFLIFASNSGISSFFNISLMLRPQTGGLTLAHISAICTMFAFLVKFPLFLVHLWLPKAHVEAPVIGSMILAALLLKLGGYGMIMFSYIQITSTFSSTIQAFSLFGGGVTALLCIRQKDIKIMIAYSSVCHMAMVIAAISSFSSWALKASVLMMVAHGLASSGLFVMAFFPYYHSHSRSILLLKNSMIWTPMFACFWFLICAGNMGGPLTINLISEIFLISSLMSLNFLSVLPIFLTAFMAVAYSLVLYSLVIHGQVSHKPKLSAPMSYAELSVASHHSIYLFLLTGAVFLM